MDRGDLVPDELIVAMVREAIERLDGEPILLDGFPRTVAQADALTGALAARGRELTAAILIDVPDETVVRWISGRHQGRARFRRGWSAPRSTRPGTFPRPARSREQRCAEPLQDLRASPARDRAVAAAGGLSPGPCRR